MVAEVPAAIALLRAELAGTRGDPEAMVELHHGFTEEAYFTFTFSLFTFVGEALLIVAFFYRAIKGFTAEPDATGRTVTDGSAPLPAPAAS